MTLQDLLGNEFVDNKGGKFDASRLAGKTVGIYFSAHWCPPCRGFTPQLAEMYETISAKHPFEIVFASSDKDQAAFDEYMGEMPWIALPFEARDLKNKLSGQFQVRGIPSLVFVDADGKTITTKGREAISSNPDGFPWAPKTFAETLGKTFVRPDGSAATDKDLEGKVLGLYFSAHWCPPCKAFTPKFGEVYKKLKAEGKDFEVVFVSSDKDPVQYKAYHGSMPWLAVPFEDRARARELSELFEVEGIPSLVILDVDRTVINVRGTMAVGTDPKGEDFPWHPKALMDMESGAEYVNDAKCLIFLIENMDDPAQEAARKTAGEVAEKHTKAAKDKKETPDVRFMYADDSEGITAQIRKLTKLSTPEEEVQMLLLDVPDNGGYYVSPAAPLTADSIEQFLADVRDKKVERKQLPK